MHEIDWQLYRATQHLPGGPTIAMQHDTSPTIELHVEDDGSVSTVSYIIYHFSNLLLYGMIAYGLLRF